MRNYIAIRFSLKYESFVKHIASFERSEWFKYRAEIMKKTLIPAIKKQDYPPFKVFIFMDHDDIILYEKYLNLGGNFIPVYCRAEDLNSTLSNLILNDGEKQVMVSRIDSDDIISDSYLSSLNRDVLNFDEKTYIVAAKGYVSDLTDIQEIYYNYSPFISIFYPVYDSSPLFFEHTKVLQKSPVINVTAEWLQVLHGSNISNRFRDKSVIDVKNGKRIIPGELKKCSKYWPENILKITDINIFK